MWQDQGYSIAEIMERDEYDVAIQLTGHAPSD
jgi:hypothetical protein